MGMGWAMLLLSKDRDAETDLIPSREPAYDFFRAHFF
jgi:hypothetical protein